MVSEGCLVVPLEHRACTSHERTRAGALMRAYSNLDFSGSTRSVLSEANQEKWI